MFGEQTFTDAIPESSFLKNLYNKPLPETLSNCLKPEDTRKMAFLVLDYFTVANWQSLSKMTPSNFVQTLKSHFKNNVVICIHELLFVIQNFYALRALDSCHHRAKVAIEEGSFRIVKPLRYLLFKICDNLDNDELKNLIECFGEFYPSIKEAHLNQAEDLMVWLEKEGFLKECVASHFGSIFRLLKRPDIIDMIDQYKASNSSPLALYPISTPTTSKSNGLAIIINEINFNDDPPLTYSDLDLPDLEMRDGAINDTDKLQKLWSTFGCDVNTFHDLKAREIKETLQKIAQQVHPHIEFFVCCLLSHGQNGKIYGSDRVPVDINEILSYFGENCPSLVGIPKLFFIQACQGNTALEAYRYFDNPPETGPKQTSLPPKSNLVNPPWAAKYSDMLIGFACIPNTKAYRTPSGSWFIEVLVDEIGRHGDKESILDIGPKIIAEISSRIAEEAPNTFAKQQPIFNLTLTKKLILKRRIKE